MRILFCTLDYPQRFGPSLADDVRKWGERWVDRTWNRVGHLYPALTEMEPNELRDRLEELAHRELIRPESPGFVGEPSSRRARHCCRRRFRRGNIIGKAVFDSVSTLCLRIIRTG